MTYLENYLIKLADRLDKDGKFKSATAVDGLLKTASLDKIAQYVGVIGYVLKQERAMQNCIRRKRAKTSGSMQGVVLSCLKEYQDGQDYHNDQWTSKYAQTIQQNPRLFKQAHLTFLAQLGHNWDIERHVNGVRKSLGIMREESVDEEKINMILSHIDMLGEILRKEAAETARPFKLAAPSRSWWSRLWNPGQKDRWSPLAWGESGKRRRGHGDDLDLDTAIQYLAQEISRISNLSRSTQRTINRLKRQNRNLVEETAYYSPENIDVARRIKETIEGIDPSNWDQTQKQILDLARETHGAQTYNANLFNEVVDFAKELNKLRTSIDDGIENIYASMHDLRGREAMLGTRPYGARNQGEIIAREYSVLGDIIDKIAENPLDVKGHNFALQQINRLNDVLTVKPHDPMPIDEDMNLHRRINDWIGGKPERPEQPDVPQTTPQDVATTPVTPEKPSISEQDISSLAPQIASGISKSVKDIPSAITALRELAVQPGQISEALDPLITQVIYHLEVNSPSAQPDVPQANLPQPKSEPIPEPMSQNVGQFTMPQDLEIDPEALQRWPKKPQAETKIDLLVKIADAADPFNKDLADAIDKYIEQHGKEVLPNMPEFGVLIKEKEE